MGTQKKKEFESEFPSIIKPLYFLKYLKEIRDQQEYAIKNRDEKLSRAYFKKEELNSVLNLIA